jgi:hypothetical protein
MFDPIIDYINWLLAAIPQAFADAIAVFFAALGL